MNVSNVMTLYSRPSLISITPLLYNKGGRKKYLLITLTYNVLLVWIIYI